MIATALGIFLVACTAVALTLLAVGAIIAVCCALYHRLHHSINLPLAEHRWLKGEGNGESRRETKE